MKTIAAIICAATLAAAEPLAKVTNYQATHRPSLYNADGALNYETAIKPIRELEAKYNTETVYGEPLSKRANNEPMQALASDGLDEDYYGNGVVGTKSPQTFTIKFDTGSATFFVPGPDCPSNECVGPTRYNQMGIDEGNTTSVTYGSGTREGENYLDTVNVAGIAVDNTQVVSLAKRAGSAHVAPDSLMGLGFGLANGKPATFFEAAMAQKKVTVNEFGFYLGRTQDKTGGNSELTLGGRDTSKFTGTPVLLPLVDQKHWDVKLDGLVVGGKLVSSTSGTATIDTGTTYIVGPSAAVKALYAAIPGSKAGSGGYYTYPCSSKPQVSFQLNGHQFLISDEDFAFETNGNTCTGAIVGGSFSTFVTGDSFLKSWYSIYSYDANGGKPAVLLAKSI